MAVGANLHAVRDGQPGTEKDIGLDRHVAAELRVPGEPDGIGRDQARAVGHCSRAPARLPLAFHRGKLAAAVDTRDVIGIGDNHRAGTPVAVRNIDDIDRSEEHTSELQSLMRISYAVFCLKKKKTKIRYPNTEDSKQTSHQTQ